MTSNAHTSAQEFHYQTKDSEPVKGGFETNLSYISLPMWPLTPTASHGSLLPAHSTEF